MDYDYLNAILVRLELRNKKARVSFYENANMRRFGTRPWKNPFYWSVSVIDAERPSLPTTSPSGKKNRSFASPVGMVRSSVMGHRWNAICASLAGMGLLVLFVDASNRMRQRNTRSVEPLDVWGDVRVTCKIGARG